jgi:hypothetical protein
MPAAKTWRAWTPAMDATLRDLYPAAGLAAAAALGVSRSAVKNRARVLGLKRPAHAWSAAELAAVREGYTAGRPAAVIAAGLGRTEMAVRRQAFKLGVRHGRLWTAEEEEKVRTRYGTDGAAALARELLGADDPHSVSQVWRLAARLGVTSQVRHPPEVFERVRQLHARGLNDRQIAAAMADLLPGPNARERVTAIRRRRLGLPKVEQTPEQLRELGRRTNAAQRAAGVNARDQAFARLATRYGLPPDTPPRAVEIVLCLAGGPKTRADIRAATGRDPVDLWNRLGTSYLGGLVRRGLVAATKAPGATSRGPRVLYLLTAAGMEALSAAAAS